MTIENQQPSVGKEHSIDQETMVSRGSKSTEQNASSSKSNHRKNGHRSQARNRAISARENLAIVSWQTRLLPLMRVILIGLTVFFLGASVYQLYGLKASILSSPQSSLEMEMEAFRFVEGDLPSDAYEKSRWATLVRLEANAIDRRYHQAATVTLARVWTIYLGFVTGMILSLVGATFILGKLRETVSHLDVRGNQWKAAVESSSPGLILAILGAVLMIVTIVARVEVNVEDRPLYVTGVGVMSAQRDGDTTNGIGASERNANNVGTPPPLKADAEDIIRHGAIELGKENAKPALEPARKGGQQ